MRKFEDIVGLSHGNGPGGSTLEMHCAAMRMDRNYAFTFNRLTYTITTKEKS